MKILDEAFLTIEVATKTKTISLRWTGFAVSEDYRRGLETALESVLENDLEFWLADLRDMTAILTRDSKWTNEEWFPKLIPSKLKRMAIVESSDYFNKMSVDRIMDIAEPSLPFKVSYFREIEEAKKWLMDGVVKAQ